MVRTLRYIVIPIILSIVAHGQILSPVIIGSGTAIPPGNTVYFLDAITGGGSDSYDGECPTHTTMGCPPYQASGTHGPWATIGHASSTLSTNYVGLNIRYPDNNYRLSPPIWSGFSFYWPFQECNFGGCADLTLYDIYSGQNCTLKRGDVSDPGGWPSNYGMEPVWRYDGMVTNGSYVNCPAWGSVGPTGSAAIIEDTTGYFCQVCSTSTVSSIPVSLEDSTNRILASITCNPPVAANCAGWQFENFTTGNITGTPSVPLMNTPTVFGFLAGGSYQAIYQGATRIATQASNLTHISSSNDMNVGRSLFATQKSNASYRALMISNNTVSDANYLTLNTWLTNVERPRIIHALTPPQTSTERTPAIGWRLGTFSPTTAIIEAASDYLISSGLYSAWSAFTKPYVGTDIGWAHSRDGSNHMVPVAGFNPTSIGTYVHANGQLFELYYLASSTPTNTCPADTLFPGSIGLETTDSTDAASYGVDIVRYDQCGINYANEGAASGYWKTMATDIIASGRQMRLEVSIEGAPSQYRDIGWCVGTGATEVFTGIESFSSWTDFMTNLDYQKGLATYQLPPGCKNTTFTAIGTGIVTTTEGWSDWVFHAMFGSPLIVTTNSTPSYGSTDLANMKDATILTIDQDLTGSGSGWLGATPTCGSGGGNVFVKPLSNGAWAIDYLNRDSGSCTINQTFANLIGSTATFNLSTDHQTTTASVGASTSYSVSVASHDSIVLLLCPGATNWNFSNNGCH